MFGNLSDGRDADDGEPVVDVIDIHGEVGGVAVIVKGGVGVCGVLGFRGITESRGGC